MQRVLVIGPCGAGKSTLSIKLGEKLDLPVFHIDQLNWRPGWIEGGKEALRAKLDTITASQRWLIDGNYGGTMSLYPCNPKSRFTLILQRWRNTRCWLLIIT